MATPASLSVVFAEEDTLFRLMEMALLRKLTPHGEKTLNYFFGNDFSAPLQVLTTMADRLGLPCEVATTVCQNEAELDGALKGADVLILERSDIDAQRIEACAGRIRLIQQFGQDHRHIDIEAARRHNVNVANLVRFSSLSSADNITALVLACARDLLHAHNAVKARRDPAKPAHFAADPPRNKFNWAGIRDIRVLAEHTIGFIGMGENSGHVAKRLRAMDMRVIYYKRNRLSPEEESRLGGISYVPLDELLGQSDFVSIHVPYEPATEKMVDAAFIAKMKKRAWLINTARGGIVDEKALYDAVKSGHLAGAALDVYRYEPVPDDCPLLDLDSIIWTPHISGGRPEFMVRESEDVLANVARVLRGEKPKLQLSPVMG
ncbi:MAG: NAD(P)-dependent oxidoreductase [Hyphomicrobiaceae bacterium]